MNQKVMNNKIFQEQFADGCKDSGLTDTTGPIIVGFSGGSDSCVLLHILNILLGDKRNIVAIHVSLQHVSYHMLISLSLILKLHTHTLNFRFTTSIPCI